MLGGNPNTPNNPFAPRQSWMSKQANGSSNPYGFGLERLAGKLALQRNVSGMPTNTVPLPPMHPNRRYATPTEPMYEHSIMPGVVGPNWREQIESGSVLPSGNYGWQQPQPAGNAWTARRQRPTLGNY